MGEMKKRRALVTGSARGTGRAIAERLQSLGIEVVGSDVLEQPGAPFPVIATDLADAEACARLAREAGEVDILVNAAGRLEPRTIEGTTVADFDRAIAINLRATFILCQAIAPKLKAKGWGRIVNFSSVVAHTGGTTSPAYAAAKAGVIAITKTFARELARHGVTVNNIAPAAIDTPLNAFLTQEQRDGIVAAIPVGRFSRPVEFAAAVAFLVSDEAGYVTGATLDVNGGWRMA